MDCGFASPRKCMDLLPNNKMPKAKLPITLRLGTAFLFLFLAGSRLGHTGTLATFVTTLGNMELELYDEDKPITVSNFVKYVTSGQFTNQFIQRWEPNFVVQAGGFRVTNTDAGLRIAAVPTYGNIKNEYS